MRKKCLAFLFLFILIPNGSLKASGFDSFRSELNHLLETDQSLNGAIAGVSIRNAANGQLLYDHFGGIRLRPASNMKLLTAAGALSVLGEDYSFCTEVFTDGERNNHTLKGNLFLKGKGDPTLLKSDFSKMAEELKNSGIKKIKGDLIGDDYWFDEIRYSVDLPWSDETEGYGAQISALTVSPNKDYDAGSVIIDVHPGKKIGDPAVVKITPRTSYIKVMNNAYTVSEKEKKKITIKREHAKNIVVIRGTFPIHMKKIRKWVGVWNSTAYAETLFKQALKEKGISLQGKMKRGNSPQNAKILIIHQSMPLKQLLVPFLKLSNNGHAEVLIKEMGKIKGGEGSWEKGLQVLKSQLSKFGLHPNTMVLRDGSGISHIDLISANQISYLLFSIQKEKWFSTYLNALPISGMNDRMVGGSLRKRMKGMEGLVQAKTGTLSTVTSLSGYVKRKNGQKLIFSILLNNLLNESKGKELEDKIVGILASY